MWIPVTNQTHLVIVISGPWFNLTRRFFFDAITAGAMEQIIAIRTAVEGRTAAGGAGWWEDGGSDIWVDLLGGGGGCGCLCGMMAWGKGWMGPYMTIKRKKTAKLQQVYLFAFESVDERLALWKRKLELQELYKCFGRTVDNCVLKSWIYFFLLEQLIIELSL